MLFLSHLIKRCLLSAIVLPALLLAGCSTSALYQAREQFYSGDSNAALATLADSSVVSSQDLVLYWLEKGLILHDAGNFEASTRELLQAAEYLADNDYISLSEQARTLLANDWAARYPGEYTERLWIHSYLMMNFLALGKPDSAAVEARRALEQIDSHHQVLDNDNFSRALIALSFEAAGQLNDAYIEYRKLAVRTNHPPALDQLLLAQANRLGFASDAREIRQRLDSAGIAIRQPAGKEAIVFVASGQIPHKSSGTLLTSNKTRIAFPEYYIPRQQTPAILSNVNGIQCDCLQVSSDLGHLINDSLRQRATRVTAKALIRAASKDSVADAIADKDELAGELVRLLFFALEEADTRSWQSLPRHLTLLRIPLPSDDAVISVTRPTTVAGVDKPVVSLPEEVSQTGNFRFYHRRLTN